MYNMGEGVYDVYKIEMFVGFPPLCCWDKLNILRGMYTNCGMRSTHTLLLSSFEANDRDTFCTCGENRITSKSNRFFQFTGTRGTALVVTT